MRTVITNVEFSKLVTFTEISVLPGFEASNLSRKQPKRRWRALVGSAEVNCNLTPALAAQDVHGIGEYRYIEFLYLDTTADGGIEVWLGPTLDSVQSTGTASLHLTTSAWRSSDLNLGRFPRKHQWIDLGAQVAYEFCRIKITDPDNPNGYVELGNVIFHPGYTPEGGTVAWPKVQPREELRQATSAGGARHRQERPRERVAEVTFRASGPNGPTEALSWLAFSHTVGISRPMCVLVDADAEVNFMDYVVYGELEELSPVDLAGSYGEYTWTFKVGELL